MGKALSAFKKKLVSKNKAKWKDARKSEGFSNFQSRPGSYSGTVLIKMEMGTKGKLKGIPIITMTCVVSEPEKCEGQSNKVDFIFSEKGIDKTFARLARALKEMFPAEKDTITNSELDELLEFVDELCGDPHDCDFVISESEYQGKMYTNLDIKNVSLSDEEDDEGDDEDEDDDDDGEDSSEDEDDDDDEDEDDGEDDDEDDDDEDDEEEEEYIPAKGDVCKMGRSKVEVVTANKRKETCTVKNVKTGKKTTDVSFEKLTLLDD